MMVFLRTKSDKEQDVLLNYSAYGTTHTGILFICFVYPNS